MASDTPLVGIVMGSDSDWPTVKPATEALDAFGIPWEVGVYSAHRTPQRMLDYGKEAASRGLQCIIACAGGAAHLLAWWRQRLHFPLSEFRAPSRI